MSLKLNRWVFKWHLKVRMFSNSRMSAGGCSGNRKGATHGPVQCVCEERLAAEHLKSAEPQIVHGSVPAR